MLLSFVFFVPPVALASDRQLIDADNSTEYYMDFASVASSGKYVKVWIGTQYKTPQETTSVPVKKYSSHRTRQPYLTLCLEHVPSVTRSYH